MKKSRKILGRFGSLGGAGLLGFSSALIVALGLVSLVLMVEVSSQPKFCGTCHVMAPYFESWETSSHRDVACVDCHIPPGVAHEVKKKWEALSMVASYFTGTYGTNPWTEIDDAACLRCHERRLLSGRELFGDVLFDHGPHLADLRRGKKLRCTSCHSQIVQGQHIAVTSSTCILCHFKGQQADQDTAQCLLCHSVPNRVVKKGLVNFDHSDVQRFDMDCRGCHTDSTISATGGEVPRERCFTCHNDPNRVNEFEEVDLMHRMHVTEHKVDCLNCHLEIRHGRQTSQEPVASGCERCHFSGHSPQSDLYAGTGGRGVQIMPAPMFSAGVACEGCHIQIEGHETEISVASEVACMSCHGIGYRSVLFRWKESVEQRARPLRRELQATARLFLDREPESLMNARHNLELVERGRGVHNVRFAFALLSKAHEFVNEARREAGHSELALPWPALPYDSTCLQCHQGIEGQSGRVFGRLFRHSRHVVSQKLDCEECHRPHEGKPKGEVLKFGASGCVDCHHRNREAECQSCHASIVSKTVESFRGDFSHETHLAMGPECADCHSSKAGASVRTSREACAVCHE